MATKIRQKLQNQILNLPSVVIFDSLKCYNQNLANYMILSNGKDLQMGQIVTNMKDFKVIYGKHFF